MNIGGILESKGRGTHTVPEGTPLDEVMRGMRDRNVGFVLVVDPHARLKGVVSERDMVRCLATRGAEGFRDGRSGPALDARGAELIGSE
jgi:CBS domain-containing protein